MAPRKPQDRAHRDAFQRALGRLFNELSGAGATLALVVLAVLVVMVILWAISGSQREAEASAWDRIAKAMDSRDPGVRTESIEEAVDEVAGTRAQPVAAVVLASLLHEKATVDTGLSAAKRKELLGRARDLYEGFLKNSQDHLLGPRIRGNLAKVLEDAGEYEEAARNFAAAAELCSGTEFGFLAGEMLWGQARCAHKLGRNEEAVELLNRATSRQGSGSWKDMAEHLRNSLRAPSEGDNLVLKGVERDREPGEEPGSAPKKGPGKDGSAAPSEKPDAGRG
jgi:tetratricopeptide (TPR) repeat protein